MPTPRRLPARRVQKADRKPPGAFRARSLRRSSPRCITSASWRTAPTEPRSACWRWCATPRAGWGRISIPKSPCRSCRWATCSSTTIATTSPPCARIWGEPRSASPTPAAISSSAPTTPRTSPSNSPASRCRFPVCTSPRSWRSAPARTAARGSAFWARSGRWKVRCIRRRSRDTASRCRRRRRPIARWWMRSSSASCVRASCSRRRAPSTCASSPR